AVAQIALERLRRPWHGRRRAAIQRWRVPAFDLAAGELGILLLAAELAARRVAGAAMAQSLHQIRAAVPFGAATRIRLVDAGGEIARFPHADEGARDRHAVRAVLLAHRPPRPPGGGH